MSPADKKILRGLFLTGFAAASGVYLASIVFLSAETWALAGGKAVRQKAILEIESALRCVNRHRAISLLEEHFKEEPVSAHDMDGWGIKSALSGDFDRARGFFKKAAGLDTESPGVSVRSALAEEESYDGQGALAAYDHALALCEDGLGNTDMCIVASFCRAMLQLKAGEVGLAAADLERSRRLAPKDVCLADLLKNAEGEVRKKTCGEWIRPFLLRKEYTGEKK